MKLREEAAKALTRLVDEKTLIDDLSVRKVIDVIEYFGRIVAKEAYQAGQNAPHIEPDRYLKTLK